MRALILLLSLIFSSGLCYGDEAPLFGYEWTFTNQYLLAKNNGLLTPLPDMNQFRERAHWLEIIEEKCPNCRVDHVSKKVHLPSGKWFEIIPDGGVLEVHASAMNLEELRANEELFQKLVWDAAKEAGLTPHERIGGGHMHLDNASHFKGDKWLYRNFIADFMNHSPAFLGGFGQNFLNAPPLSVFGKNTIRLMRQILKSFDHGDLSLNQLRSLIRFEIYQKSPDIGTLEKGSTRLQALNLNHEDTTEIRALRPQLSMRHSVLLAQIFQARIAYLATLKKPVPLRVQSNRDLKKVVRQYPYAFYQSTIRTHQIEDAVKSYIIPSGIPYREIAPFLTEEFKERRQSEGPSCKRLF